MAARQLLVFRFWFCAKVAVAFCSYCCNLMDPAIISHLQQKNLHSMVQYLATHSLRLFKNIERLSDLNSRSCVYSSIIVMINYSKLQNITSPLGLNKDLPRAAPGTRLHSLSGLRRRAKKTLKLYSPGSGLGWAGLGWGREKLCFLSSSSVEI